MRLPPVDEQRPPRCFQLNPLFAKEHDYFQASSALLVKALNR